MSEIRIQLKCVRMVPEVQADLTVKFHKYVLRVEELAVIREYRGDSLIDLCKMVNVSESNIAMKMIQRQLAISTSMGNENLSLSYDTDVRPIGKNKKANYKPKKGYTPPKKKAFKNPLLANLISNCV